MTNYEIDTIVDKLGLIPHPEGGFYKETYRSKGKISTHDLTDDFEGDRNFCTSIYFLLTSSNFSAFHRIKQDEVWHFYYGSPLTVHVIDKKGQYIAHKVGFDINLKLEPQLTVPAGCWFASSIDQPDAYALVGCTVAPGFDFRDFELADRNILSAEYPQHKNIIEQLTRK